ncbi:MAG: hypothetical protein F6J93_11955 [Oscillatoria sp. SIO1A7]|nr:hypothetical protein [Oscillatoria sp. SIO1A7]
MGHGALGIGPGVRAQAGYWALRRAECGSLGVMVTSGNRFQSRYPLQPIQFSFPLKRDREARK